MGPVRSPLGAIGVILVAMEAVFGGALFALESAPLLRVVMAGTMIAVFVPTACVVLWMVVYLTVKNPGFLFNPADVAQLKEPTQRDFYDLSSGRLSLEDELPDSSTAADEADSGQGADEPPR